MAFTYETVTIDSTNYNVYVVVADADDYLGASLYATDWTGATTDNKSRALVMATRLIDRQVWDGSQTDSDNEQDWPRSGLTDDNGNTIDSATIPQFVKDATAELALSLLGDQDVETFDTTEVKRVAAGSAQVEFFRGEGDFTKRFPTTVQELLGPYLAAANSSGLIPYASGVDEDTIVDINSDLNGGYA